MFLWRRDGIMLAFAMLFPTLATALYFVVFAGTPWMQPVYSACKVFQFALPILWVWAVQREPIRMRLFDPNGVAMGFGFGACVVAALLGVYYALPRDGDLYLNLQRQVAVKLEQIGIVQPVLFLLMAAFLAVIHSLFEEYYWRWFVFGQLRRGIPVVFAVILSGLAFALHHVIVIDVYLKGQDRWTLLPAFAGAVAVGGMVWAYIYHRSGSMAGPWLSHFLVDAGIMWIGFDLLAGKHTIMNDSRAKLLELVKQRALIFKEVILASGQKSSYYIDGKMILMHSESAALIGDVLYEMTREMGLDAIGGPEVGGIPIATAAVIRYHQAGKSMEGFFTRKEVKSHGTQKRIEGRFERGYRVAIAEDVMTTGGSSLQTIESVQQEGGQIEAVICLVDRLQGARQRIEGMGLRFLSVFTLEDLGLPKPQ